MTAKDAVVTVAEIFAPKKMTDMSDATARLTGITSDMSSALKGGADDGQRTSGKRKGASDADSSQ